MRVSESDTLSRALDDVDHGRTVELTGLYGSSAAMALSAWIKRTGRFVTAVAPDERRAAGIKEDLEFFLGRTVPLYPAAETLSADDTDRRALLSERLNILLSFIPGPSFPCIVTPVSGLLAPVPCRDALESSVLRLEKGGLIDLEGLTRRLVDAGFSMTPMVTAPSEFSVRGDIIDIYPMAFEQPVRVELYDIQVESIRLIDLETQRSVSEKTAVTVPLPVTSMMDGTTTLKDHLPEHGTKAVFEPLEVDEKLSYYTRETGAQAGSRAAEDWISKIPGVRLFSIATGKKGSFNCGALPALGVGRGLNEIKTSIDSLVDRSGSVSILCQTEAESSRLEEVMTEAGIPPGDNVRIMLGRLTAGFQLPDWGQCYINHFELMMRIPVRWEQKTRRIRARAVESFSELDKNDLVVHLAHGIARYEGITRVERKGGREDFLKLAFKGDTLLYVPASKMHLVEKYVGGEGQSPKPDKLGGTGFSKRKENVESALQDLAADLLDLQAVREEKLGTAFDPDDELIALFEASFPYQDTDDQVEACADIKRDMEKPKPMDRLLCGDVGFGKTELALRAAFKSVCCGKQAALLVPTTILAQQHYETFQSRLADYPVTVEVLSRFKNRSHQKKVIDAARTGNVDILIGTHRLLSGDVGFHDLGILVIDEEQRFGVVHKERLKRIKRTVDVLTMTATPIPRTLHMALTGLKDISNLKTPPEGRTSIKTTVVYKSDELIRNGIFAELDRGGQVFYLHNRVGTIVAQAEKIQKLVPEARVACLHGQMKERDLEEGMIRFIKREIDVLVCTTIIESGIDLPGVNTIFIDRADRYGLADLHQLRGRVGRGHVSANAYLLVPAAPLSDVALRRLKAIEELSQLGSGFRIALKDLEIRGAGNILGAEQHGHIAAVGYELYCRLLRETVRRMKGLEPEDDLKETDLDIRMEAYIPEKYIPDERMRLELLRKLGKLRKPEDLDDLKEELKDRFGRIPAQVLNLIDLCLVRFLMGKTGIKKIAQAAGHTHLQMLLYDEALCARIGPFETAEMRFIEPGKAHLHPPKACAGDPVETLKFLKSGLLRARRRI